MSRIGKKPIIIPQNVTAKIDGNKIEIKGPNGSRNFLTSSEVEIELNIPELGFDINVAEIILTECETVNQFQGSKIEKGW